MKHNGKRFLSLLLSLLLTSGLISCGESPENAEPSTEVPSDGAEAVVEEEAPDILAGLNYGGATFSILTSDTEISSNYMIQGSGELTGDNVNDAVFERNLAVEEAMGVSFEYTTSNNAWSDVFAAAQKLVLSGDCSYDLLIDDQRGFSTASVSHLFLEASSLPTVDLDEGCWWKDYMMNLSVDYKSLYLLVGDYFADVLNHSHAILYNRDVYRDLYGDPDEVYTMVQEGRWTYENWQPLVDGAYADLDGDGKVTPKGDRFGMIVGGIGGSIFPFSYSSDCQFVSRDADGYPTLTMYSERLVKLYDNIRGIFYSEATSTKFDENGANLHAKFIEGGALFISGTQLGDFGKFRDMENDIGIIPYPKLDESQERYITVVHDTAEVGAFPLTVRDSAMCGAVVQMLCRTSHETVLPTYYEESLKIKYARDDASSAMIDLIHDGITDEFCLVYGGAYANDIFTWALLGPLQKNGDSITADYESREKAAIAGLEKLMEDFNSQPELTAES